MAYRMIEANQGENIKASTKYLSPYNNRINSEALMWVNVLSIFLGMQSVNFGILRQQEMPTFDTILHVEERLKKNN